MQERGERMWRWALDPEPSPLRSPGDRMLLREVVLSALPEARSDWGAQFWGHYPERSTQEFREFVIENGLGAGIEAGSDVRPAVNALPNPPRRYG